MKMNKKMEKKKIAALVADAFQDSEFFLPKIALEDLGFQVEVDRLPCCRITKKLTAMDA